MGVEAEAEIGLASPVLEVVERFGTGTREVGDFILREAGGFQALACGEIETGGGFFVGNEMGVVARAAGDQLETLVADDLWPLPTYQEMLFIK